MDDKLKIINFIQDFGCATLKQLQILFNKPNDNFKDILSSNVISRKGDIFVHNTATIDMKILNNIVYFQILTLYMQFICLSTSFKIFIWIAVYSIQVTNH